MRIEAIEKTLNGSSNTVRHYDFPLRREWRYSLPELGSNSGPIYTVA